MIEWVNIGLPSEKLVYNKTILAIKSCDPKLGYYSSYFFNLLKNKRYFSKKEIDSYIKLIGFL